MTIKFDELRRGAKVAGLAAMALGLVAMMNNSPSMAKGTFAQNHPRRAQVLHRDNRENNQINNDYGHLGGHYGQLEHEDNSIKRQEQSDARQNGGYITKGEQTQLNHEENGLERQIDRDSAGKAANGGPGWQQFKQNHPRRAEVLGRDGTMNRELNNDEGRLNGQYGNLKADDASIRSQEQSDAKANGGYITQGQKQQLNQEENQLQRQINKDNSTP